MSLQRAATEPQSRAAGLNTLLRLYLLRVATGCGVGFVVGSVPASAPRVGLMRRAGYSFYPIEPRADDPYNPFNLAAGWRFAALDLARDGGRAIGELTAVALPLLDEYPLADDLSEFAARDAGRIDETAVGGRG